MKSLKEYLPESFITELSDAPRDSISPVNGSEVSNYPNPANSVGGVRELNIGDPVIVTGKVQHSGETGVITDFDNERKAFVVVQMKDGGKHSFHSSDVAFNDYDEDDELSDEEQNEMSLDNLRKLSGIQN